MYVNLLVSTPVSKFFVFYCVTMVYVNACLQVVMISRLKPDCLILHRRNNQEDISLEHNIFEIFSISPATILP